MAVMAVENTLITISYLVGCCQSAEEHNKATTMFELAAPHLQTPIQS